MTVTVNLTTNSFADGSDYAANRWPIISALEGTVSTVYIGPEIWTEILAEILDTQTLIPKL